MTSRPDRTTAQQAEDHDARAKAARARKARHQHTAFFAGLLVLGTIAVAFVASTTGCGGGSNDAKKPTSEEILALRAKVEPARPADAVIENTTVVATPAVSTYHPWTIKETAVDSLGRIGEDAVPNLIAALSDKDAHVRAQAARALARIGPEAKAAVQPLIERLNDPDEEARQAAARALGQIGPAAASAVPALIAVIESADSKAPASLTVPRAMPPSTPAPTPRTPPLQEPPRLPSAPSSALPQGSPRTM